MSRVNTTKYIAGSVCPATASAMAVPVTKIIAKAYWSKEEIFAIHYDKNKIRNNNNFQKAILVKLVYRVP